MNLFDAAIRKKNTSRPPLWFMRQAGRYHSHYQAIRKQHSFIELCKIPEVACEVTMGPIQDFDYDAAILFSDLLFPLEAMGMGLKYDEGPKLDWHLRDIEDLAKLKGGVELLPALEFQGKAMSLIRKRLDASKGLLGFVGGPLTLFCYAVEGSHQGNLSSAHEGLIDGRYDGFVEKLADLLAANMALQAKAGASAVAIFDTCAGEFDVGTFRRHGVSALKRVLEGFRKHCPETPVIYYSKRTGPDHWRALEGLPFQCLGVDWHHELPKVLVDFGPKGQGWAVQGNIDPDWLFLPAAELEFRLRKVFAQVKALPADVRAGWVCGLGHGVLPKTPEANVKLFIRIQREIFSEPIPQGVRT